MIRHTVIAQLHEDVWKLLEPERGGMAQRILIIEDNVDNRELLTDALEFAGYTIAQAKDGVEGEAKAKEWKPDLILLDISLPLKSGWEVARALQEESTREIPIIALTAHAREEDRQRALETGCRSYLPKPVKPKDVIREIQKLLQPLEP